MAIFKSLTFDGINSLDYGIYITGEAAYNAPERAVEMVSVPGRNGNIAIDQGRFENIEVTYHAGCFADSQADFADKVMKFRNALASRYTYKRLTDEYHPDEYRLGLYKSGLEVDAVHYSTAGEFDITFDCKPQRFLISGETALAPSDYIDTQTATGEIVTIDSDGSLAVRSLEVSLSPIQDLNGYDKPWVGGNGKNKIYITDNNSASEQRITITGTEGNLTMTSTGYYGRVGYSANVVIGQTYTFSVDITKTATSGAISLLYLNNSLGWDANYRQINISKDVSAEQHFSVTFTADSDTFFVGFYVTAGQGRGDTLVVKNARLEVGSTETAYSPYSNICPISGRTEVATVVSPTTDAEDGRTYTTALGRTVYGGTLDVVSGVLTVDRAMVDLGTLSWVYESAIPRFYSSGIASVAKGAPASNKKANIICSAYKTLALDGSEDSIYGSAGNGGIALSTSVNLSVKDTSYTNATAFKTAVTGQTLVYELATPQTYQLTPQQIDLLLGTNHLWSDGEVTVEYGVHPYYNPTQFESKPLIVVTGKGILQIGDYVLTIVGRENQTIYIDCESQEAWEVVGAGRISRNDYIQNAGEEFPVLVPGVNNISVGSGITVVTITPRWWRI